MFLNSGRHWKELIIPRYRLWRNAVLNLAGVVVPALVALACTPFLLKQIGPDLFGMVSIQIAVLVLVSVTDFGVSRAVVLVAIEKGGYQEQELRLKAVRAGVDLVSLLSLIVAVVAIAGYVILILAESHQPDRDHALSWLLIGFAAAISLPTLPLRARMEIEERFGLLNLLRSWGSSLIFAAPVIAAWISPTLVSISLAHLISRSLLLLLFSIAVGSGTFSGFRMIGSRLIAGISTRMRTADLAFHGALLRRGGWLGLAGLVSMLISYSDRFVLGSMLGAAAVANYAVAAEVATKLWLVVGALTAAAMPRIAAGMSGNEALWKSPFRLLSIGVIGVVFVLHGIFSFAGARLLSIWLGDDYHSEMATLLTIFSLGITINCISQLNYLLLLIKGGERAAAKLQFIALPLTVAASAAAAWAWGPIGVAIIFALRLILDSYVVRYLTTRHGGHIGLSYWLISGLLLAALAVTLVGMAHGSGSPFPFNSSDPI